MKRPEHAKDTNPIVPLLYRAQPSSQDKAEEAQGGSREEERHNAGNDDWNRLENMKFESTNEQRQISEDIEPRTRRKPL